MKNNRPISIFLLLALIASTLPIIVILTSFPFWPIAVIGNFLIQGIAVSIAILVFSAFMRKPVLSGLAALTALVSFLSLSVPTAPLFTEQTPKDQRSEIKIAHINLFGKPEAVAALIDWVQKSQPDVIAMTELPGGIPESDILYKLFETYGYRTFSEDGGPTRTLIASRHPISDHQTWSRYISRAKITLSSGEEFTVFSLHPPPPLTSTMKYRRNAIISRAFAIANQTDAPTIVLGDFNAAQWLPIMKNSAKSSGLQWVPLPRFTNTWLSKNPLFGLPLDHIYTSQEFQRIEMTLGPNLGSDHYPLIANLAFVPGKE